MPRGTVRIVSREQAILAWKTAFKRGTLEDRFWDKVVPEPNTGCLLWTAKSVDGYGQIRVHINGINFYMKACRLAYLVFRGELNDLHACHSCDTPACVNPDHLWPGDAKANLADMTMKGRRIRGESHPNAKLTDDQVRAILLDGRSHREIAADFGVCSGLVSLIKSGDRRVLPSA